MPIEQIADHMGNSFTPNRVRHTLPRRLETNGAPQSGLRVAGPPDGRRLYNQETALRVLKAERQRQRLTPLQK